MCHKTDIRYLTLSFLRSLCQCHTHILIYSKLSDPTNLFLVNKEIKQNVSSAKTFDLPYTYYIFVLLILAINRGKVYILYNN